MEVPTTFSYVASIVETFLVVIATPCAAARRSCATRVIRDTRKSVRIVKSCYTDILIPVARKRNYVIRAKMRKLPCHVTRAKITSGYVMGVSFIVRVGGGCATSVRSEGTGVSSAAFDCVGTAPNPVIVKHAIESSGCYFRIYRWNVLIPRV